LSTGSRAYLVDDQGRIILPADERFHAVAFPQLPAMLRGDSVVHEYASGDAGAMIGAWSGVSVHPNDWWVVVEVPRALAYATVQQNVLWLLGAVTIVIVTTLSWGLYQSHRIVRPIEELHAGAVTLGEGDLAARIPVHSEDEIGLLAAAFNRMAQHLQSSREEIERQNERLREGLALARDIQLGLLPSTLPGNVPHLAIQAHSLPAYEVGGDFYTYIALDEQRMAVAIGDISGKGVGAALMMALAASTVEAHGRSITKPNQLLAALNKQLSARLTANNMNAALLYAIIDMDRCSVSVANAGMICPFLLREGTVQMIEAYGLPLGAMPEARYSDTNVDLQPGDLLVLISDGIVEAHSPHGVLWGFDRLEEVLRAHNPSKRPDDLIAAITAQVHAWMDGAEQHDDMTIVVIQPSFAPSSVSVPSHPLEEVAA
jgi:serine phosphatase RsbU (regulator of sigma subunit)